MICKYEELHVQAGAIVVVCYCDTVWTAVHRAAMGLMRAAHISSVVAAPPTLTFRNLGLAAGMTRMSASLEGAESFVAQSVLLAWVEALACREVVPRNASSHTVKVNLTPELIPHERFMRLLVYLC